jgi:hypothetical protein
MALVPEESTFLFETPHVRPRENLLAVARISSCT